MIQILPSFPRSFVPTSNNVADSDGDGRSLLMIYILIAIFVSNSMKILIRSMNSFGHRQMHHDGI